MKVLIIAIAVALMIVVMDSSCVADGYTSIEFYPNGISWVGVGKGNLFGSGLKIDVYSDLASDLGATVGLTIGPIALGIGVTTGASADGDVGVTHTSFDLTCVYSIGRLNYFSYTLINRGHGAVKDFGLMRVELSLSAGKETKFPVSIIGHNLRLYNGEAQEMQTKLFWGPALELGEMGIFKSNKLCFAVDILDPGTAWAMWKVIF